MRDDLVDLVRHGRLSLAVLVEGERIVHEALDEVVALVGDDRLRVVAELLLAVADVLLDVLHLADADVELLYYLAVALEDLDRVPAYRAKRNLALYRLLDVGDRVLNGAREHVRDVWKLAWALFDDGLLRHLDELLGGFHPTLVLERRDPDDLAAERLRDLLEVDLVAVLLHDVHHVDGHHHRQPQLRELRGEVEVSLDVRSVNDVQDRVRTLLDEEPARNLLLDRVRRKRVDAGKVLDHHVLVSGEDAVLLLDRHARPVADVLLGPRKRVEKRRLAAVRVAREGYLHFLRHLPPPRSAPSRR